MKFDDAEYYFLNFQTELPTEAGGIPIGMYLLWLADRRLLAAAQQEAVARRNTGPCSGADLLFDLCDGKLMAGDLSARGLAFTEHYYPRYIGDYIACFGIADDSPDALCDIAETPENQARLTAVLDRRFAAWEATAAAVTAAPVAAAPTRPTANDVLGDIRDWAGPLLERDGFQLRSARWDELTYVREHGGVNQWLRLATTDLNGRVMASLWLRLGCTRLRKVWFSLLDPAYRARPPIQYSGDYTIYPDLEGSDNCITQSANLLGPYITRLQQQPQWWGRVMAAVYTEQVKPLLDTTRSAAGLARIATFGTQMNRQRNHLGRIRGAELLGRIVLLAAYTNKLTGPDAVSMRAELLEQYDRALRAQDEFPARADVEQLLAKVVRPGFADKARGFLEG